MTRLVNIFKLMHTVFSTVSLRAAFSVVFPVSSSYRRAIKKSQCEQRGGGIQLTSAASQCMSRGSNQLSTEAGKPGRNVSLCERVG